MTLQELRLMVLLWEAQQRLHVKAEKVEDRTRARIQRDGTENVLQEAGFGIGTDGGGNTILWLL